MTTPHEFYTNVVEALDYLDTQLPSGSHLVFIGMYIFFETAANN